MSFTKTLVPRSPSGINIIGEYDIFYALQTSVADFYPTTTTPKPVLASVEYEDEQQAGVDGDNANAQTNGNGASDGLNTGEMESNANGDTNLSDIPGLPQNVLVSDPNFNVGKHPGEIYVDMNTSLPPRRYDYSSDYYYNRKYDWAKGNSVSSLRSKKVPKVLNRFFFFFFFYCSIVHLIQKNIITKQIQPMLIRIRLMKVLYGIARKIVMHHPHHRTRIYTLKLVDEIGMIRGEIIARITITQNQARRGAEDSLKLGIKTADIKHAKRIPLWMIEKDFGCIMLTVNDGVFTIKYRVLCQREFFF